MSVFRIAWYGKDIDRCSREGAIGSDGLDSGTDPPIGVPAGRGDTRGGPAQPGNYENNHLTGFGITAGLRLAFGRRGFEASNRRKAGRSPSALRTGTMLGLAGGGIVGGLWAAQSSSDDLRSLAPPVMSLYGAGIGAAIGAVLDAAR